MPNYALLGATGATGAAILRALLKQPPTNLNLNVFVRSKVKLDKMFPNLETTTPFAVTVFEGTPNNSEAISACLQGADVVMACIASNIATKDITVHYDAAAAIVGALQARRSSEGLNYRPPTIIQIRSVSLNAIFKAGMPLILRTIVSFCFFHAYNDMARGNALYISAEEKPPALLNYTFVDPPALHDADGTNPTGFDLILDGPMHQSLSYADLGVAFCDIAERKDEFYGKGVGVSATGAINETWGVLLGYMFQGAKSRIFG